MCDREWEYNIQINCKIWFWCPVVIVSNNRGVCVCVCVCACIFLLGLADSTHTHTRLRLTHWAVICCPEGDTGLYYYTTIFRQKPWFSHTTNTHLQKKHTTTLTQCNEAMYEITDSILSIYTVKWFSEYYNVLQENRISVLILFMFISVLLAVSFSLYVKFTRNFWGKIVCTPYRKKTWISLVSTC